MKIYSNIKYIKNKYEMGMSIKIFREDNEFKIVIDNKFNEIKSQGIFYIDTNEINELTEAINNANINGVLDPKLDRAEKYKSDVTKCPHNLSNKCTLPTNLNCKRRNCFGYCSANW
jgi:uncharacterized protein YukJ